MGMFMVVTALADMNMIIIKPWLTEHCPALGRTTAGIAHFLILPLGLL